MSTSTASKPALADPRVVLLERHDLELHVDADVVELLLHFEPDPLEQAELRRKQAGESQSRRRPVADARSLRPETRRRPSSDTAPRGSKPNGWTDASYAQCFGQSGPVADSP